MLEPPSDAMLVRRARAGDGDAYADLVRRHAPLAHRTALVLGAGDDVADVVQEAFVRVWRTLERFDETASFRAWLLTIVANEARNRHRSGTRGRDLARRLAALDASPREGPGPDAAVLAAERRTELVRALDGLPAPQRDVVVARYLLELSEDEAAAMLGVPRGTVKSRCSRALRTLGVALAGTAAAPLPVPGPVGGHG